MLRHPAGPILLLVLLWLPGVEKGLWLDEYGAIAFADSGSHFLRVASLYNTPPLYYLLLALWRGLGESEWVARLLSLPFAVLTVWAIHQTVAQVRPRAAHWAGYLAACHPALLWQYQEIRPYSLLLGSISLAAYFGMRLRHDPEPRWRWGFNTAIVVSLLTHTVALLALPLWFVWGRLNWRKGGLPILAGVLVVLTVALPHFGRPDWWFGVPDLTLLAWIGGSQGGLTQTGLGATFFLALLGYILWRSPPEARLFLAAYGWLWASAMAVSLVILPMMVPRTLTYFLVFLLPALALCLRSIWEKRLAALLMVVWCGYWLTGPGIEPREPLKTLFTQLEQTMDRRDIGILTPAHLSRLGVGSFYTSRKRRHWLVLGGEKDHELQPNYDAFRRSLKERVHRYRQFRVYLVVRRHLAPWVEEVISDYVGPADGEWKMGQLRVLRFSVSRKKRNELIRLYFPRPKPGPIARKASNSAGV